MAFSPHVDADREKMLARVGVSSIDELFADIPAELQNPSFNLPKGISEVELSELLKDIDAENLNPVRAGKCFLGGGAYNHYIPSAVDAAISQGSLYTAYTPYQPEMSQGMLQAIFEYQTLIARLTGLDASNASMYDGATATFEACAMAIKQMRKKKVLFSTSLNPHYRQLLTGYGKNADIEMQSVPHTKDIAEAIDGTQSAVVVQNPDFFGRIKDFTELAEVAHKNKCLLIMVVNPISLGLLKSPGEMGADIAVGEGQPLGIPLSYGGPYLGFIAATKKMLRKMPGRIVGETKDVNDKCGFVLTLQAREQHIRRDKATSNICSNQALCALSALAYMSMMGKSGLRELAELCIQKAAYAKEQLAKIDGVSLLDDAPTFNEFVIKLGKNAADVVKQCGEKIEPGIPIGRWYEDSEDCLLVAVTEMNSIEDIDELVSTIKDAVCS